MDQQEKLNLSTLMSAAIAHKLRTPLARCNLQMDVLDLLHPENDSPTGKCIQELRDALDDAHNTIEMLLLKSKSDSLILSNLKSMTAIESIQHILHIFPFKGDQKNLVAFTHDGDFTLMAKPDYLKHVLFNLLKNALYAIQKARKGHILIHIDASKRTILFEDTGSGIDEKVLPHIFEPFYTQSEHGMGAGLALCKRIMTQFGGTLDCDTKPHKYTRFMMAFPNVKDAK